MASRVPSRISSVGSGVDTGAQVRALYRAWYRQVPQICELFTLDIPVVQCRARLKELFMRNKDVTDPSAVEMLVIKGKQDLDETVNVWKQKTHVMRFFEEPEQKPQDFMSKFLRGE